MSAGSTHPPTSVQCRTTAASNEEEVVALILHKGVDERDFVGEQGAINDLRKGRVESQRVEEQLHQLQQRARRGLVDGRLDCEKLRQRQIDLLLDI